MERLQQREAVQATRPDLYFQTPAAVSIPAVPTSLSPGSRGSSPGPTESGTSITLSWGASRGSDWLYGLSVRDIASGSLSGGTPPSPEARRTPPHLTAGKQYRWNVNACSSAGCSSYAADLYFQTPAAVSIPAVPTSLSPGSGSSPGPTEIRHQHNPELGRLRAGATSVRTGRQGLCASGSLVVNTTVTRKHDVLRHPDGWQAISLECERLQRSAGCSKLRGRSLFSNTSRSAHSGSAERPQPGFGKQPGSDGIRHQHNPELGRLRGSDFVRTGRQGYCQRQSCGEHHRHRKHGVLGQSDGWQAISLECERLQQRRLFKLHRSALLPDIRELRWTFDAKQPESGSDQRSWTINFQ